MVKRDTNQTAKAIIDFVMESEASGKPVSEIQGSSPIEEMPLKSAAAAMGRKGGLRGGKARAKALTPEERRQPPHFPDSKEP